MKYIKTGGAIALALSAMLTFAHAEDGVTDTEVRLGGSTALTGPGALVGIAHDLGEKIAAAEINEAGGINGRKLVRHFEDDGYVPARTVQAVRKLLDVDKVLGITASSGTASTMAALPIAQEKNAPMLQSAAPNQVMYDPPKENLFVPGKSFGDATYELVKFLNVRKAGLKYIAVVQDDDYGKDVQGGYDRAIKEAGLTSVGVLRYKRGQKEFAAEVLKAKELGADMIVSGGIVGENVAMAKEIRRIGMKAELATLWPAKMPQIIDLMGEAAPGVISADYVVEFDDPAGQRFLEKANKYLTPAEVKQLNRNSISGYVGLMLMADAIKRCGQDVTRACVIKQLEETKDLDVDGLMTPITYGPGKRLADTKMQYSIIDGGKKEWVQMPE
jgi:branched-chain amino acid transport system substrate-binding protein